MNVLIVEDEPRAAKRLVRLLSEVRPDTSVLGIIDTVEGAAATLTDGPKPDVILADIELADGSVFDLFDQVNVEPPVIFCTAYDQHALRAFDVNGVDYLLKPIDAERLTDALDRAERLSSRQAFLDLLEFQRLARADRRRFLVRLRQRWIPIPVEEIAWFHTANRIVNLTTMAGDSMPVDGTLERVASSVPAAEFFRVSRQVLISSRAIRGLSLESGRPEIITAFSDPARIPVSRDRFAALQSWLDT